jgi:hypothetical protein
MLVTLLTKATTLKPDLPVFAPDFQARAHSTASTTTNPQHPLNGKVQMHQTQQTENTTAPTAIGPPSRPAEPTYQASGGASSYPAGSQPNYPAQAAPSEVVPEGHPERYPLPGQGLMKNLPSEQEDLQWLVEDDDRYGVFTHMHLVDPQAANTGLNGGQMQ